MQSARLCIDRNINRLVRRAARTILSVIALGAVSLSQGSSVDPRISVGDPSTGIDVFSDTFAIQSDVHGGGVLNLINDTGNTWTTLDFFVTLPSDETITCSSSWYSFCGYTTSDAGDGRALFDIGFEQPTQGGITPGSIFSIDLNDSHDAGEDKGSWGPFMKMEAIANFDIPEPASWRLIVAACMGGLIMAVYRRVSAGRA